MQYGPVIRAIAPFPGHGESRCDASYVCSHYLNDDVMNQRRSPSRRTLRSRPFLSTVHTIFLSLLIYAMSLGLPLDTGS